MLIGIIHYPESYVIYQNASRKMNKWAKIGYFIFGKIAPISMILPKLIFSLLIYSASNDSANNELLLPFPWWFPFDTQTTHGYIVAVVMEFVNAVVIFLFLANAASLGFGAFIFLIALVKDLKANLKLIDKMGKHRRKHSKMFPSIIIHFIDLHSDLSELSVCID